MFGFHLVWVLALAMVAYADVVDGGCRDRARLLGPVEDEVPGSARQNGGAEFDAWLDAVRRWRHWSASRSPVRGVDGLAPVSRHPQYR